MWDAFITHQAGDGIKFAKAAVKEGVDALAVYAATVRSWSNQRLI